MIRMKKKQILEIAKIAFGGDPIIWNTEIQKYFVDAEPFTELLLQTKRTDGD